MIEFKDWDGDIVMAYEDGDLPPLCYCIRFTYGTHYAVLSPDMCRALAADLLAFAGDTRQALAADLDSTITAVLANYTHAIGNNGGRFDMGDVSTELRDLVRRAVLACPRAFADSVENEVEP